MTFDELFEKIDGADFEGVGLRSVAGQPTMIVKHKPTGLASEFSVEFLKQITWEELEPVLTGKREPRVLEHMSRICGYYSRMSQWNQSKIGELADRRKGNYAFQEAAVSA